MKFIIYAVIYVLISIFTITLQGYALTVLWDWFIINTFNTPSLSIPVAIGIMLVAMFLQPRVDNATKDQSFVENVGESLAYVLIKVGLVLSIGWVVIKFI